MVDNQGQKMNPLEKLAEHFARMYLHMAKAVEDRCGQEVQEAVAPGFRQFALEREA
ncbi:MAG: hypothetical protein HQK55_06530, partial [Deltaproteobacteria bacterium]|nr:hypothetical protein [Deltaproteobacteria bacterium]